MERPAESGPLSGFNQPETVSFLAYSPTHNITTPPTTIVTNKAVMNHVEIGLASTIVPLQMLGFDVRRPLFGISSWISVDSQSGGHHQTLPGERTPLRRSKRTVGRCRRRMGLGDFPFSQFSAGQLQYAIRATYKFQGGCAMTIRVMGMAENQIANQCLRPRIQIRRAFVEKTKIFGL